MTAVLLSGIGDAGTAAADEAPKKTTRMFDGKTLDGWSVMPKEAASDWRVEDGAIVGEGSVNRQSYLVWRNRELTDFELRLQYRMRTDGNTGVEVRARKDATGKRPFEGYHADLGHVGIGDNILGAWDFHFAKRREHACNRGTRLVIDANENAKRSQIDGAIEVSEIKRRDWNDVRIVARKNHFQFFINGKPAAVFTDNAREGQLESGAIGLQLHEAGTRVEFRKLVLTTVRE